jgi:hypothetical protein
MSEAGYIKDEHYQFLLKYFPGTKIPNREEHLWADTIKVIENLGLENKVTIDEESFHMFILDYFTDIARLKDFQGIERANVSKIYGYEIFWFLRRHPIQLLEGVPDNFDINEKVAIGVFLPRILAEAGLPCNKNDQGEAFRARLTGFVNLLFYNFKYRTYTQQSLEFAIDAFLCGSDCTRLSK